MPAAPHAAVSLDPRRRRDRPGCPLRSIRKVGKDLLGRHTGGQVFQDVLDGQAQPPDARLPAALVRFKRNQLRVVHEVTVHPGPAPVNERRTAERLNSMTYFAHGPNSVVKVFKRPELAGLPHQLRPMSVREHHRG